MREKPSVIEDLTIQALRADQAVMSGATPSDRRERWETSQVASRRLTAAVYDSFRAMPQRGRRG